MTHGTHFFNAKARPCWECVSFVELYAADTGACRNPQCPPIRSQASRGCVSFEREIGAEGVARPAVVEWRPATEYRQPTGVSTAS